MVDGGPSSFATQPFLMMIGRTWGWSHTGAAVIHWCGGSGATASSRGGLENFSETFFQKSFLGQFSLLITYMRSISLYEVSLNPCRPKVPNGAKSVRFCCDPQGISHLTSTVLPPLSVTMEFEIDASCLCIPTASISPCFAFRPEDTSTDATCHFSQDSKVMEWVSLPCTSHLVWSCVHQWFSVRQHPQTIYGPVKAAAAVMHVTSFRMWTRPITSFIYCFNISEAMEACKATMEQERLQRLAAEKEDEKLSRQSSDNAQGNLSSNWGEPNSN